MQKVIKKYFIFIISLLFLFISISMKKAMMIRILFCFLFIAGSILFLYREKKIKKIHIPLICLLLFIFTLFGDAIISYTWKKIPIYAYNITTTSNVRVYNAFGITVWQCDKENYNDLIVAPFYKKGYLCEATNMKALDSNTFFKTIIENYDDYQNTTIKIKGRIYKKGGNNYIEMKPFTQEENGTITFQDTITLSILLEKEQEKLENLTLYEEIEVIGTVKNREILDKEYIIYLYEAQLVN